MSAQQRQLAPQRHHALNEARQRPLVTSRLPIDPARFVVLTIRVVVAVLRARKLVARQNHRRALCAQQRREHAAHLLLAARDDGGIVRGAFYAVVARSVVVAAVGVVLAVGLVVFLGVAHQIVQREPVVRRDEVQARPGLAAAMVEDVRGCAESGGQRAGRRRASPEVADAVAELVVPFGPPGREASHLIAARPAVPRFGDQLDVGEHRILNARDQEGAVIVEALVRPRERGAEVESKAVDVRLRGPVPEAVGDHLRNAGMPQIERVARARIVVVVTRVLWNQPVVGGVVDALERQCGSALVAFGCVVVDDVQNDLEPGVVKARHHFAELLQPAAGIGQVAGMWRKKPDAVVAPVIREPAIEQMPIVDEQVDRHQFDAGDAKRLDVVDDLTAAEAGKRAAVPRRQIESLPGIAADVQLVNRLVPRNVGRRVSPRHSTPGSTTTAFGMKGALSRASNDRSPSSAPIV